MRLPEITQKLKDSLEQWGVPARVAVRGRNIIEIRMEDSDEILEQYSIQPKNLTKRPLVKTHATARPYDSSPRHTPKKPEPKSGFNLHLQQHKDSMDAENLNKLLGLTRGYSFLSATRDNTKVWDTTCREIIWMASGLFVDSHKWDKGWLSKMEEKGGGPAILKDRFKDIPSVIDCVQECLDYVANAHEHGGYWYPPLEKGKVPRKSLASFICSQTKAGTEWSPFCEVLWEMNKDTAIKSAVPRLACIAAEQILKESQYLSSIPNSMLATYWTGVKKYVDWYYAHRDELLSIVDNRVRLADVGMAVMLVREWNASASGRALPTAFIYPGSDKWFRFTQWCKTNRGVILPDYRR